MTNNTDFLKINALNKSFSGVPVLSDLSLEVSRGSLVTILGKSGCGKTTLFRCISCIEMFDSGSITIDDITLTQEPGRRKNNRKFRLRKKNNNPFYKLEKISRLNSEFFIQAHNLRSKVGMLFQNLNLFPNLKVIENVAKSPEVVLGISREQAMENAARLLDKVGMKAYLDRMPYQLSGGQAQRVAIARALAMSPKIMLYDEPTSALDPGLIDELLSIMKSLKSEGMTQLVITHSFNFSRKASDLIAYLDDGKIIEMDKPENIFSSPKDQRTYNYLKIIKDEA